MGKRQITKFTVISLTALLIFTFLGTFRGSVCHADLFAPTWLKEGVYAEYKSEEGGMYIPNSTSELGFDGIEFVDGTFRWECLELNDTTAKLKSTLTCTETHINGKPLERKFVEYNAEYFVDTHTRAVYTLNGTLLGTTCLWLPANPSQDDEMLVWDLPPDKVFLNASVPTTDASVQTPQGVQRAFFIEGMGNITDVSLRANSSRCTSVFILSCDYDTGLMVYTVGLGEPAMDKVLGFISLDVDVVFADTIIDLRPRSESYDWTTVILLIALPVVFVIIFVAAYRSRRKKR